jgi:NADPH2 dehydrogenase
MQLEEPINSHVGSGRYGENPNARVWKPIKLGNSELQHRVFLTPLTRMRAIGQVPSDLAPEYYSQRTTNGGLLVTEATFISKASSGYPNAPGIYTREHVEAWKKVVDAVHEKGGVIFCQLWNIGVANYGEMADVPIIGPGSVNRKLEPNSCVPMTTADVRQHLEDYRQGARFALEAGFDGCEG